MARSSPPATRHRTPSLELTGLVIAAALRIIGSEGIDAVTVRRLAAEADVAPMSIYNRFGDMNGVFDAVFHHGFDVFAEHLGASDSTVDPVLDLHRMGKVYRVFALENPDLYRFMFLTPMDDLEPSEESSFAAAQAFDALHNVVIRSLDSKRFRPGNASVIAQQIWATCHGAVALELLGMSEFADVNETYDALLVTLLRGLLRNPEESVELA
jgi:AcrR family transcriptional regulator